MDDESKKIAQETFDKLPQDVKETIFADDYARILNNEAEKHDLNAEQLNKLQLATTMVLMGVDTRANYPFTLEFELGVDEDTAQSIATEIEDIVFSTIEESLDKMDADAAGTPEEINAKIDYEEKKLSEENPEDAVKTDTSLTSLSDRLKQATIAMPGKRDFNLESTPASAKATAGEAPIDPYHEPIDNE